MATSKPLTYGGVTYRLLHMGGAGWSAGRGSTIEALDGPHKGKIFLANIGNGIREEPKLIQSPGDLQKAISYAEERFYSPPLTDKQKEYLREKI